MRIINCSHDSVTSVMTDFPIVNSPYLSSNIPDSPAYGDCISQLMRYARVCSKYEDFMFRGSKLLTTFRKFYGIHRNLVHKCDTSVSNMLKVLHAPLAIASYAEMVYT